MNQANGMDGGGAQADPASNALWVVIPAFNEATVIAEVVRGVRGCWPHVVVVDDCSRDETAAAALRAGAVVLRHAVNLGQGAAIQTGLDYALSRGARYIVTFDADGQHQSADIGLLLDTQRRQRADVVVGSRFLGRADNMPPLRRLVLKLAVRCSRNGRRLGLTDAHNGLRLFTRAAARRIRIGQNRMAHASEIVAQLAALGLRVAEAPVTIVYTAYSLSKGQKLSNAANILAELMVSRLSK